MDESQLLKGILEGCVLAIISRKETYGYDIMIQLDTYGFHNVIEGTLYPVLTRLEKKEFVRCRKAKSPLGPVRKYYSITKEGETELEEFQKLYQKVTEAAEEILFQKTLQKEEED